MLTRTKLSLDKLIADKNLIALLVMHIYFECNSIQEFKLKSYLM